MLTFGQFMILTNFRSKWATIGQFLSIHGQILGFTFSFIFTMCDISIPTFRMIFGLYVKYKFKIVFVMNFPGREKASLL